MLIKKLPRLFIESIKGIRKMAFYQESRFLYDLNRKICFSQYPKNHADGEVKIIVSLTTHKERIGYIHYVLDSLYTQTLRPVEVRLYVAQGEYQKYPFVVEKFKPWLKIIETEDIGSYKKFIPALREAREDEIVVSLDDDFIYPSHLIFSLYSLFLKNNKDALIAFNGQNYIDGLGGGIGGGLGVLWNPHIFNPNKLPEFFNEEYFWKNMEGVNADDAWISFNCLKNNISIIAVDQVDYNKKILRSDFIPLPSSSAHAVSSRKNYKINKDCEQKMRKLLGI